MAVELFDEQVEVVVLTRCARYCVVSRFAWTYLVYWNTSERNDECEDFVDGVVEVEYGGAVG